MLMLTSESPIYFENNFHKSQNDLRKRPASSQYLDIPYKMAKLQQENINNNLPQFLNSNTKLLTVKIEVPQDKLSTQTVYQTEKVKHVSSLREGKSNSKNSDAIRQKIKQQSSPRSAKPKQVKYLGLIIEKDNECEEFVEDPIKRTYIPIRDRYIEIVKLSRSLTVESLERRGSSDFKRTKKTLSMIGSYLKSRNQI